MQITLSSIVSIAICIIILTYINKVQNYCGSCTRVTETNVVKIITTIILIKSILMILLPKETGMFLLRNPIVLFVLVVIGLVNIVAIYRFVNKMMSNQCKVCTSSWKRTFLYYYSRFAIALIVIDFLMVIGMGIWLSSLPPSKLKQIKNQMDREMKVRK
jgi:hypothetical protein